MQRRSVRRSGALTAEDMAVVMILGQSIDPAVVPGVNDSVAVDGVTYMLIELMSRDPAAAMYEFISETS